MSDQTDSIFETQLGVLGDLFCGASTAKILDFLLMFREFDYSEADISRSAGVSARHLYRSLPKLEALELVQQTRFSGRSKMYKLKANSLAVQALEKFAHEVATTKIQDKYPKTPVQSSIDKDVEPMLAE
ncbi:MAG: hypothetical protein ABI340_06835 [Nitrososphaera sp.]|jgi:DNA-binding transcriptional ArsR family regulator